METKLYKELAQRIQARANCQKSGNTEWFDRHTAVIAWLIRQLPHGAGLDGTWRVDYDKSRANRIVLTMDYHAMNDAGYYGEWIDFRIAVTPDFVSDYSLAITGNFGKYQNIRDYLYDTLHVAFAETVDTAKVTSAKLWQ